MISIGSALKEALLQLKASHADALIDSEVLLSVVINKNRAYLYAHPEQCLTRNQYQNYIQLVQERAKGMPIAYLTHSREFWSLTLKVTPDTLIPRHETERIVELALELIPNQAKTTVLDLGTGSGAIALALAKERPTWQIDACDKNKKALLIAQENAQNNHIDNVQFYHSDWFNQLPQKRYHAILSNPPYIAKTDPHLSQGDVQFEPTTALVSEKNGLADIQYIIQNSYDYLLPHGILLLEHGYDQKKQVSTILNQLGYENIKCWQDLMGHDRVSGGSLPDHNT